MNISHTQSEIPVSVIVPVKNEADNIKKCLQGLTGLSEVIVVDSQSEDETCQIARDMGATVVSFDWNGRFPKKRNWTIGHVPLKNDWVLFVDADEYLTDEFKDELRGILPDTECNGFHVTYHNYFMGKRLKYGDTMRKLPLFRVGAGAYEKIDEDFWCHLDMEVHEHPIIEGRIGKIKAPIIHNDFKGYEAYVDRHNAYSTWEARRYLSLKKSGFTGLSRRQRLKYYLMDTWLLGPLYFFGTYIYKCGFLDGKEGAMLAVNKMFYFFQVKCKITEFKSRNVYQYGQK